MRQVLSEHVPYNSGWVGDLGKGQVIRIIGTTTVDFLVLDRHNLRERFDQARTKVYNGKIFLSTGDKLMSRDNRHFMTILEDTFEEGTHDLQKGMCSGRRFRLAREEGRLREYYHRDYDDSEIPDHGCWENLSGVLAPYGIAPEDVPSPFNIFQHMIIDGRTGLMQHTSIRPKTPAHVDLRAERDLLAAFSACPDMPVGGKPVDVEIFEGNP